MAVTRLKRKARKIKIKSYQRKVQIKHLLAKPRLQREVTAVAEEKAPLS